MVEKRTGSYPLILTLVVTLAFSGTFLGVEPAWAESLIATIPVSSPNGIVFDPANGNLYVTNIADSAITVISGETNKVVGNPIPVGSNPFGIVFDPANGNLYVTSRLDNTVSVISGKTNTVIGSPIPVGSTPLGIAFDAANGNLYVANINDNTVSVISGETNKVVGSIHVVSPYPLDIAFDSANGDLYVTSGVSSTVSVISGSSNTVIGSPIPVGQGSAGIAFDSANGDLYIANSRDDTVSVIDGSTNTVIGSPIPVGNNPFGIAFDSANGNLYVTNRDDNTVSVISGSSNTVIGSPILVGTSPQDIAFDSANGDLYVTNIFSDTVSVISTISQQQPDTTITSAIDGNGATVQNGSSTLSTSIQFTFTATTGTNPITGFQCSLDDSEFSTCASPTNFNNLVAGKEHTFQARAVDTLGNKDPTPAIFSWTILTPKQGTERLIQLVKSMNLDHGLQTNLIASLNAALNSLTHSNNHVAACNQLNAFVNKVHAAVLSGRLDSADALQLMQSAEAIQKALGCSEF